MLKSHVRLFILLALFASGAAIISEAGDRRRTRNYVAPAMTNPGPPTADDVITYCPRYTLPSPPPGCQWYAIKCKNGHIYQPFMLMGPCSIVPQIPCADCYPLPATEDPQGTVVVTVDGFEGELKAPVTVPNAGTAKIALDSAESAELKWTSTIHENVIVKAHIPTNAGQTAEVFVQLVSQTMRPQHPLDARIKDRDRMGTLLAHTGHQILSQAKVEVEIDAAHTRFLTGRKKVLIVNYLGDDYTVLLQK